MGTLLTRHINRGYGLINPVACTDKELKQYLAAVDLISGMLDMSLLDMQNIQVGYSFTMDLGTLCDSWQNDDFIQQEIRPATILNLLLDPKKGLLTGNTLVRHIVAMFPPNALDEQNIPVELDTGVISDGRHRFSTKVFIKIIQLLLKQEVNVKELIQNDPEELKTKSLVVMDSEEFRNTITYVHPALYDPRYVELANTVRKMPVDEKIFIKLQNAGIDISEHSIAKAIIARDCTVSDGMQGLFTLMNVTRSLAITNVTACSIGKKVAAYLKDKKYMYPSTAEDFSRFIDLAWTRVGMELNSLLDQGVTEIARHGVAPIATNVGNYIASQGFKAWMTPEQLAAIKSAPPAKTKTTSKKAPKNPKGDVTVKISEPSEF